MSARTVQCTLVSTCLPCVSYMCVCDQLLEINHCGTTVHALFYYTEVRISEYWINYSIRAPRVSSALSLIEGVQFTSAQNAACPKFDMVWLNRSPIPEGVISSFKWFRPAFPRIEGGWRWGSALYGPYMFPPNYINCTVWAICGKLSLLGLSRL